MAHNPNPPYNIVLESDPSTHSGRTRTYPAPKFIRVRARRTLAAANKESILIASTDDSAITAAVMEELRIR